MKLTKKLAALALAAALCVPAAAAGTEDKFPAVNVYPGYADVQETDWFYDNAKLCYEIGIITGTDKGFEPFSTLTVAQCTAIAARMRETLTGEAIPTPVPDPNIPWYQHYVDYMRAADPSLTGLTAHPSDDISRYQFLLLLNAAIPEDQDILSAINTITALPDTDDGMVLAFYNAGILTGVDPYGTFAPDRTLNRAEAAAMISRIARSGLRKTFVPEEAPADITALSLKAAYLPSGAVVLVGVTSEEFVTAVNAAIARYEAALGENFNWHADVGGKTVLEAVKDETLTALGVTADQGGELYKDFDYQVYYSRLIDLTGETL